MPRKFPRILIEIIRLFRSCAGRGREAAKPKAMENTPEYRHALSMMDDQAEALRCKRRAYAELKKLAGLQVHPRTDWEAHKWTRIEVDVRTNLFNQVDRLIPTYQLYGDLYENS